MKLTFRNFRCRSAFKLAEIDDKHQILRPGMVVVDCGCAPGSWSQVAVERVNSNARHSTKLQGLVVGVDLLQVYPLEHATLIGNVDFTTEKGQQKIREVVKERKLDVVLSDMAPKATGVRDLDQDNIMTLCYSVLRFAVQMSQVDATVLMKVWSNGDVKKLETDMGKYYKNVRVVKPNSSRNDSAEHFLLGRGFLGLES